MAKDEARRLNERQRLFDDEMRGAIAHSYDAKIKAQELKAKAEAREREAKDRPKELAASADGIGVPGSLKELQLAVNRLGEWQSRRCASQLSKEEYDKQLSEDVANLDAAIRKVLRDPAIEESVKVNHPVVQARLDTLNLFDDAAEFRSLRDIDKRLWGGRRVRDRKPSYSYRDLWLLQNLPEPPQPGGLVHLARLQDNLLIALGVQEEHYRQCGPTKALNPETFCPNCICWLEPADAEDLIERLRRSLSGTTQNLQKWLRRLDWHALTPRQRPNPA